MKKNIFWVSNPPFISSAYAVQTRLTTRYLEKLGYRIGYMGMGQWSGISHFEGKPVYPTYTSDMGNDIVVPNVAHFFDGNPRDGIVITLLDVWTLDGSSYSRCNTVNWLPIDHDTVPPPVQQFLQLSGGTPIAYSKFGQKALLDVGISADYIPHGFDTKMLCPGDKKTARGIVGVPEDAFIIGMVAVNKGKFSRKSFTEVMEAFKIFKQRHSDALLFLHTEVTGVPMDGVRIRPMAEALGIHDSIVICDQYKYVLGTPDDLMAELFRSFDVTINVAQGEGFGCTIVESQLCGTPVIIADNTSQSELLRAGWKVQGTKYLTNLGAHQFIPHVDEIVDAMEEAYNYRGNAEIASLARTIAQDYDIENIVATMWKPKLEKIFADLEANTRSPVTPTVEITDKKEDAGPLISVIISTADVTSDTCQNALVKLKYSTANHEIILIQRHDNWTFSSAVNQGIKAAKGEYILLLNDDCYVHPYTLEVLRETLSQDDVGVVGGLLLYPDNKTIQHAGGRVLNVGVNWDSGNLLQGQRVLHETDDTLLQEVDFVTGALLMTKKSVLDQVGLLDESLESYFEDTDLCLRIKQAGLKVIYDPRAQAIHIHSATMRSRPEAAETAMKSRELFQEKYGLGKRSL